MTSLRFAVIEYDSKSHDVWHHTDARPNYLADPLTEIDPTSFGCYVSALKGEHIPLTKLAKESTGWLAGLGMGISLRKAAKRLTGRWPHYSIDYLKQFDVLMFVHQLSDAAEVVRVMKRLRHDRGPFNQAQGQPVIVGVPTQPYGLLKPQVEADDTIRKNLINFINTCDIFISLVQDTVEWYEDLGRVPVKYLPQPYPASFASQNLLPPARKNKTILVAGVTQRNNIKQGQLVAKELQKQHPNYVILLPKVHDLDYDYTNIEGARYETLPFEQWREHLKTLASVSLVVNTDYTNTRGRVQVDCAAVGTPSLGGNSDGQRDLYPELSSEPTTKIESLVDRGMRLLTDAGYYQAMASYASDQLKKYNYEESATRLQLLVNTISRNKLST